MSRKDLRKLVGVITEHFFFNKHLKTWVWNKALYAMLVKVTKLSQSCVLFRSCVLFQKQFKRLTIKKIVEFISNISFKPE